MIICTYNRVELLKDSIRSIQAQDFPADRFEILVVDNNSDKGMTRAISEFSPSPVALRYFFERKQGLSFARNTGISNASGEIIVFTDDDIEADKSWLSLLLAPFDDTAVACVGGPIRPIWTSDRPGWLTDDLLGYLTVSEFEKAKSTGEFKYPCYPWGANIAFRKDVFETIGLFPENLGRTGKSLLSNEEVMLCRMIERAGKKIAFAPRAVIHHKIPPGRLSKGWFYQRAYWQGRSEALVDLEVKAGIHERLRRFAADLLTIDGNRKNGDLDAVCYRNTIMGYLHEIINASGGDFRRLRMLNTFTSELVRKSSDINIVLRNKYHKSSIVKRIFRTIRAVAHTILTRKPGR